MLKNTLIWDLSNATQRKNFLSIKDNLWIEGYAVSNNSGDTGLQLTYRPIKPLSGSVLQDIIDTMNMTVVKVDLEIWPGGSDLDIGQEFNNGRKYPGDVDKLAISESKEERKGAYLLVNWDDDDGDVNKGKPTPDLYEDYVKEEDNLSKMLPIINPILDKGIVELEIVNGEDKIRFWRGREKGQEIKIKDNKKIWDLSNSAQKEEIKKIIQKGIFIEGISASDKERDITIKLSYKPYGGKSVKDDTVKVTVVMINLGNAVYRKNYFPAKKVRTRGHAGILYSFIGNCIKNESENDFDNPNYYQVIEMHTDGPAIGTFTNFRPMTTIYWGAYSPKKLTYRKRLLILRTAEQIYERRGGIEYTWQDAIRKDPWDGDISNIKKLRCDGLVEAVCEKCNINLWGKIKKGKIHYSIISYTDEHNDFDSVFWQDTLQPATQCGYEHSEKGKSWETTLRRQNIYQPNLGGKLK